MNGDGLSTTLSGTDLEQLKSEIIKEMKLEIQKVKQEIIDGKINKSDIEAGGFLF